LIIDFSKILIVERGFDKTTKLPKNDRFWAVHTVSQYSTSRWEMQEKFCLRDSTGRVLSSTGTGLLADQHYFDSSKSSKSVYDGELL